jgi:hypothetical protein
MRVDISVHCDNAAFDDNGIAHELEYVLKQVVNRVGNWDEGGSLKDSNGHKTGFFKFIMWRE